MFNLFAHAGELHESSNESFWHYLGVWYIAAIVFVIAVYVLGTVLYALTKKSLGKTLCIMMGVFLVVGLISYEKAPLISVLSIICGFVIALGLTFSALMVPAKKK